MIERNRASQEYLKAVITAADALGDDLPVEMAVTKGQPTELDWLEAEWATADEELPDGTHRRTAALEPDQLPDSVTVPGTVLTVWARLTSAPEVPVVDGGTLSIT